MVLNTETSEGKKDADTVILKGYTNNPCHLHYEHILSYVDLN